MPSELDAHHVESSATHESPTELQLLLDALHAAAVAGDPEAARMLQLLRQSLH